MHQNTAGPTACRESRPSVVCFGDSRPSTGRRRSSTAAPTAPVARPRATPHTSLLHARTRQPVPLVLGHVRLDLRQFPDLMPQRLRVAARELRPACRHSLGRSGYTSAHWSVGITLVGLLVAGLSATVPFRLPSRWLRPGVRVLRAGWQRGVLRRLALRLPFQLLDPCFQLGNLRQQQADDGLGFRRLAGDDFFGDYRFHANGFGTQPARESESIRQENAKSGMNGYALSLRAGIGGSSGRTPRSARQIAGCRDRECRRATLAARTRWGPCGTAACSRAQRAASWPSRSRHTCGRLWKEGISTTVNVPCRGPPHPGMDGPERCRHPPSHLQRSRRERLVPTPPSNSQVSPAALSRSRYSAPSAGNSKTKPVLTNGELGRAPLALPSIFDHSPQSSRAASAARWKTSSRPVQGLRKHVVGPPGITAQNVHRLQQACLAGVVLADQDVDRRQRDVDLAQTLVVLHAETTEVHGFHKSPRVRPILSCSSHAGRGGRCRRRPSPYPLSRRERGRSSARPTSSLRKDHRLGEGRVEVGVAREIDVLGPRGPVRRPAPRARCERAASRAPASEVLPW